MYTLVGIQETVVTRGPWIARIHKPVSRLCVRLIINRWGSLTKGNEGERKWAKQQIIKDVSQAYPIALWLVQILVSVIIKWLVARQFLGVDEAINQIRLDQQL